ncbi:hypothetical protein EV401DRAFT_2049176 [Pisolithus croceorrhizus]|nr:hypothetical protein EV401DRAFT_2049176 [Pisolithus croceorrhizus]
MITTILETLFGIHIVHLTWALSHKGIFGHVNAYFGVVESQGWGSLHLHMLLWLMDAPMMEEMEANIWAYLPATMMTLSPISNDGSQEPSNCTCAT